VHSVTSRSDMCASGAVSSSKACNGRCGEIVSVSVSSFGIGGGDESDDVLMIERG
jgi:hypothetical protein